MLDSDHDGKLTAKDFEITFSLENQHDLVKQLIRAKAIDKNYMNYADFNRWVGSSIFE